ncbi:MAG TPA: DNA methyltransferase [Actinomycetes bacterium]|jgi:site-specific DNA-methyltransferase (adenine-specific)|nr:DNA methyltransferase [Actinomycetes bacterium]
MTPRPYSQEDGISLYHGDCRDVLPELPPSSVDLLLTDPPYGKHYVPEGRPVRRMNIRADGARQGVRVVRQALFAALPLLKADAHVLVFCHWESWPDFYDAICPLVPIKNALIWHKDRGGPGDTQMEYARDYEVVLYGAQGRRAITGRRDGAVVRGFPPVGPQRLHPTEKPADLLGYFIAKHCPPGGTVLDPFAGSGSTLLAAWQLGRCGIGVEIDQRYCQVAATRLQHGLTPAGGTGRRASCA